MSMHNLLELDNLRDNSPEKPRPMPRIPKRKESIGESYRHRNTEPEPCPKPKPRPRRKGRSQTERDVDDVVSMSSISSGGDHISQSAFDNPVFLNDDGTTTTKSTKLRKQSLKNSPSTKEKERQWSRSKSHSSDESEPGRNRRKKKIPVQTTKGFTNVRVRYTENLDTESGWDEDEYLYIENEANEKERLKTKTRPVKSSVSKTQHGPGPPKAKPKRLSQNSDSDSDTETEMKSGSGSGAKSRSSRNKKDRVGTVGKRESTEMKKILEKKSPEDPPGPAPVTVDTKKSAKPKIGKIWQRFLTKGSSNSTQNQRLQSVDKDKAADDASIDQTKEKSEGSEPPEETPKRIKSDSDSEEDTKSSLKQEQEKREKIPETLRKKENMGSIKMSKMQEKLQRLKETGKKRLQNLKSERAELEPEPEPQIIEIKRRNSKHFLGHDSKTEDSESESQSEDEQIGKVKERERQEQNRHRITKRPPVKHKQTKTRKTLKSLRNSEVDDTDTEKPNSLLGITIHGTDLLPLDPNILHPIVKVTMMTQDGKLIEKSKYSVNSASRESVGSGGKKKRSRKEDQYQPREMILPIMTQAFKFKLNCCPFAPSWNELLLFEEPFNEFLSANPDIIIFFEIVDFLSMEKVKQGDTLHGTDTGWYKLAWGFLKPVGANGVLNVERKLRLQLFKPVKLRRREILDSPEVYSWWKCGRRVKMFNTTLYVTVKGVTPPYNTNSSLKQLLSMRKEDLTEAILESQLPTSDRTQSKNKNKQRKNESEETIDLRKAVSWARLKGQSCKAPNKLLKALPSQPKLDRMNLAISGNVYCLKFSPCGLKLAAGLNTDDLHAVLIFDIPSGNLLRSLGNHHGLIYDLEWKEVEVDDYNYYQYICSASADATACVWKMKNSNENTIKHVKTLHHPSFVYCVKFHPSQPSLVVTGCFDFIIRVWDVEAKAVGKTTKLIHDSSPLFILDRHCSFVNCLLFDTQGTSLFSGDGDSHLYKWHIKSALKRKSWIIEKEVKLTETGRISINSLSLHPNGVRLLVHLRDNCLKILDSTSLIHLKTIRGLVNERLQIRSCFSPCGNLILSGSEEPTVCVWDSDTYQISNLLSPKNHPSCFVTSVDYHPFDFYLAVGIASAISEPNPILLYAYDAPRLASVAMVQAGVSKFKSNLLKRTDSRKVTFAPKRGDSSEKFISIINKLDKALKEAQDPKRIRHRSESLQRSVSVDIPDIPETVGVGVGGSRQPQSSRPSSAQGNFAEIGLSDSDSVVERKKYKSKSPRTYIEERLEELILPASPKQQPKPKSSLDQTEAVPTTATASPEITNGEIVPVPSLLVPVPVPIVEEKPDTNATNNSRASTNGGKSKDDGELFSPKHLPKPRRTRPPSKIPISVPESPRKAAGDTFSNSSSNHSTPIKDPIPTSPKKTQNSEPNIPSRDKDQGRTRHVSVENQNQAQSTEQPKEIDESDSKKD